MAKGIDRRSALGWILGLVSLRGRVPALPGEAGAYGSVALAATAGGLRDLGGLPQTGGMVFDVRAFGARGDALRDRRQHDTDAFQAAIDAAAAQSSPAEPTAGSGSGGVVFVPQGVYRITRTLRLPSGVSIRGAGMYTSQIAFAPPPGEDGLVWSLPEGSPFGSGGFLEDIDILAESQPGGRTRTCRNLVVLSQWSSFVLNRVRILGAREHNLRIHNCVNVSAFHLVSQFAGRSNLWIGAARNTVTTTCRFVSCYLQASERGPSADVAGLGLVFDGCVFENAGTELPIREAGEAYGIRVRGGTATLMAPYFEANRSWELIAGTDEVPPNSPFGASVTVINPVIMPHHDRQGALVKAPGTGGFRFERGSAFIQGGNFSQMQRPLVFSTRMDMVSAVASLYPGVPEVEGGTLAQLPGTVQYKDPASGNVMLAGSMARAG